MLSESSRIGAGWYNFHGGGCHCDPRWGTLVFSSVCEKVLAIMVGVGVAAIAGTQVRDEQSQWS